MESRVDSSSIFAYIYNVLTSDLSDRSCTRSTECTETDGTTRETHYAHTWANSNKHWLFHHQPPVSTLPQLFPLISNLTISFLRPCPPFLPLMSYAPSFDTYIHMYVHTHPCTHPRMMNFFYSPLSLYFYSSLLYLILPSSTSYARAMVCPPFVLTRMTKMIWLDTTYTMKTTRTNTLYLTECSGM